jgi:hypothetical protein
LPHRRCCGDQIGYSLDLVEIGEVPGDADDLIASLAVPSPGKLAAKARDMIIMRERP